LQFSGLPMVWSSVQGSPSSHFMTQGLVALSGSQVSLASASTTPSPQVSEQSPSARTLQSAGQQSSPVRHSVIARSSQSAVHDAASPDSCASTHVLGATHISVVRHVAGGSQVSPLCTTRSPHEPQPRSSSPSGQSVLVLVLVLVLGVRVVAPLMAPAVASKFES
jgi:hypothetical protein